MERLNAGTEGSNGPHIPARPRRHSLITPLQPSGDLPKGIQERYDLYVSVQQTLQPVMAKGFVAGLR
jgi:hypothetical protein